MTDREQDRRDHERVKAELAENQRKIAYNMGLIDAKIDNLRADPKLLETCRAIAVKKGMTPEDYLGELLDRQKAMHHEQYDPSPSDDGPLDPAVKKFREMLS